MKLRRVRLVSLLADAWLLVIFVVGFTYGEAPLLGEATLYIPLLLLFGGAIVSAFWRPVLTPQGRSRILMALAVTLSACVGAVIVSDQRSIAYALLMLLTWSAAALLAPNLGVERVMAAFCRAGALIILYFAATTWPDITARIVGGAADLGVEARYRGPFEAHPNLIGHMVGTASVAMFYHAFERGLLHRLFYLACSALGLIICLAAASRGGLFAAVGGIGAVYGLYSLSSRARFTRAVLLVLIASCAVLLLVPNILDSLVVLLDLDSSSRGLDSGLSGRTGVWSALIGRFGTADVPLLWGGGFRNEWLDRFGVIDNGYLVVLVETGAIGLGIWVWLLAQLLWRAAVNTMQRPNMLDASVAAIMLFGFAEAVVNQQFLAIGNAASLLMILLAVMYLPSKLPNNHFRPSTLTGQRGEILTHPAL